MARFELTDSTLTYIIQVLEKKQIRDSYTMDESVHNHASSWKIETQPSTSVVRFLINLTLESVSDIYATKSPHFEVPHEIDKTLNR